MLSPGVLAAISIQQQSRGLTSSTDGACGIQVFSRLRNSPSSVPGRHSETASARSMYPAPDARSRQGADSSMLTYTRRQSRFPNLALWVLFAGLAVLFGRIIPALF